MLQRDEKISLLHIQINATIQISSTHVEPTRQNAQTSLICKIYHICPHALYTNFSRSILIEEIISYIYLFYVSNTPATHF